MTPLRAAAAAGAAARSDRLAGRAMTVVGVLSMVVGLLSAVIGASLISSLRSSVDDSLDLTSETLETADDSIAVSASIVDTLRLSIDSVSAALVAVQTSVDDTTVALGDVGEFMSGPLATSVQSVADALPTLERTARTIDDALALLSRVPLGPDYQPEVPFAEAVGGLAVAIEPLPEELRLLNRNLTDVRTSAVDVAARLGRVIADIDALTERLDEVDELLRRYSEAAAEAQEIAVESRRDLDRNATLGIVLAVLIGILVIASQIVPLWLGRRLTEGRFAWPVVPADDDEGGSQVQVVEVVDATDDDTSAADDRPSAGDGQGDRDDGDSIAIVEIGTRQRD